jgi:hypothetical protein
MAKLSTYTNNLFVTHATMDVALEYATTVANACETPSAVMTAIQAVLNTAISMHRAELAAANKPLIELIDARVAAAVADLQSGIDDQISEAISDFGIDGKISEAIDELDLDDKMQGWFDSNFDIESALSGTSISITFD